MKRKREQVLPRITREQVLQLPLRLRIAWGISIVEAVLKHFPMHFLKTFHGQEAIDYAWSFALAERDDPRRRKELIDSIGLLTDQGQEEGYAFQIVFMPAYVLEEIGINNGKAILAAVEASARGFAGQQLFRQGLTPQSAAISHEYIHSLEEPVFKLATKTLDLARSFGVEAITRGVFSIDELRPSVEALRKEQLLGYDSKRPKL